ncbi:uncharacterized protein [Zea mays]|jgi:hypothetical protein|uniref:Uncharacterized protein n=1 Tax=Zea mays TaxID=4577 RepID=B6SJ36_MAIZE|nr:uncharacterized protein LOC111589298 [Zea mays]ACG24869.1 hypothetical protein [Zea mays]ACG31247.1 hypothetical protein [Zea mays]|eukprot:XP_023155867.1 uncharacterized protein LOC111589298 [Zea mays]
MAPTRIRVALLSLALVGLLICHLATTASAGKNRIRILDSVDDSAGDNNSSDASAGDNSTDSESEGRVVYSDMKLADETGSAPAPAPAPGPTTS